MPRHHPPHTKRQEPISNFNTITYFYIYIHKKTKAKQFILSKDNSKLQDSQHKSDYERERERERENRNTLMLPKVRGGDAATCWRLRFLFPDLAFAVADLTIFDLGQVNLWSHHRRIALGVQCFCCNLAKSLPLLRSEDVRFLLG